MKPSSLAIPALTSWSLGGIAACIGLLWLGSTLTSLSASAADLQSAKLAPVPVILDTDIGDDIDDTWALALLLKSTELNLKLVVSDYGEAQYRARLLAKLLERAGLIERQKERRKVFISFRSEPLREVTCGERCP